MNHRSFIVLTPATTIWLRVQPNNGKPAAEMEMGARFPGTRSYLICAHGFEIIVFCLYSDSLTRRQQGRITGLAALYVEVREDHVNWLHQKVCRSERWRRRIEAELLPWTLAGVELGEDLLEIGPGPGVTTDVLRSFKCRLTVLEIEGAAAAALQERLNGSNVRVVHGDGTAIPFADGSFSGVVAFTMLHHVETVAAQDALLSEARRVLRPRGVFAGFDGVDSLLFRLAHLGDGYLPADPSTFGRRLQAAGFTDVTIEQAWGRFRFRAKRP